MRNARSKFVMVTVVMTIPLLARAHVTGEPVTYLLKDILSGPQSSRPGDLANFGGRLVLSADDGAHGVEPWISDGTTQGTRILKDIVPGSGSSAPRWWIGRHQVAQNFGFSTFQGKLIFAANDGIHGNEIWVSDGTSQGTMLLKDIYPGPGDSLYEHVYFFVTPEAVYFAAAAGTHGKELWRTDGTPCGTWMVSDVSPGSPGSDPRNPYEFRGWILFTAYEDHGRELWLTDGTEPGTRLVKDIGEDGASGSPGNFVRMDDHVLFTAFTEAGGRRALGLWKTNGFGNGTEPIKTSFGSQGVTSRIDLQGQINQHLFFSPFPKELWVSDGTERGTDLLKGLTTYPDDTVNLQGFLYLSGEDGLLRSDATPAGTTAIRSGVARQLTSVRSQLFFRTNDDTHGMELWTSDGTPQGTSLLKDIAPGPASSIVSYLASVDDTLYFQVLQDGWQLWKTEGTESGTRRVPSSSSVSGGFVSTGHMSSPVLIGSTLYYIAGDGVHGDEVWVLQTGR